MSWIMNDKEYSSVMALSGPDRYSYAIKRVADQEEIWSLWAEDGWALASDDQGRELIPVWPHPRLASACAKDEWAKYQPRSIDLESWMEKWTPGMLSDHRLVAVFPIPSDKGVVVEPERFGEDLELGASLYE